MAIGQVYNEVLLAHYNDPQNKYGLPQPTVKTRGVNPSCGDEIELSLKMNGDVIEAAAFEGDGCAISQASTDMMIDLITGRTLEQAQKLCETFIGMIQGKTGPDQLNELGEALSLKAIAHMPARVKCAELSWYTLEKLIKEKRAQC